VIRIVHGDMLIVLPTLPANSTDAVVTDPPYGRLRRGGAQSGVSALSSSGARPNTSATFSDGWRRSARP